MELGGGSGVFGFAGCFAAEDHIAADPRCRCSLFGDLFTNKMIAIEFPHLCEGFGWNTSAENREVGHEPDVSNVVCGGGDWRQRCGAGVEYAPHPNADDGDIALHVHAVRTIVGT